jgi:23S rRNA (guanine2445-N2)-methyltransferase / 23S rRNA (guanine2069-N7)-methyltransferase
MCGSGTFPIEAALMAMDCAPGLFRSYFGFLGWKYLDVALWELLWDEAQQRREAGLNQAVVIAGYDRDEKVLRTARGNAERAGLAGIIRFERREIGEARPAVSGGPPGLVVINPPYGERLGRGEDLGSLYSRLGDVLKQEFRGWTAALLTGSEERRPIGLKPRKVTTLYNGALACTLSIFDIAEVDTSRQKELHPAHDLTPFDSLRLRSGTTARGPRPGQATQDRPEGGGTIISTAAIMSPGAESFANRLRKNLRNLEQWATREKVTCYRLYDEDLPEYKIAIDLYGGEQLFVHVQEYEAPKTVDAVAADRRFREAMAIIPEVLGIPPDQLFCKVRKRQKGASQYTRLAATGQFHEVAEGPCRFLVNFTDYLDTGLFLDHRPTRELLRNLAAGKKFLNLFGYTGTATAHAAAGGAIATTTVDLSATYLDWARRNLELNGFVGTGHELVRAECREWLEKTVNEGKRRWGLIFLDPPSFSNSKRMAGTFDVQRDHAALIGQAVKLLEPDGVLIFSTNLQSFALDTGTLAGLILEDLTTATIPPDYRRNPHIHSCWRVTVP